MAYQKKKPENAAYKKLLADLAADTLGTAYIFYGEESYLREYYISEIRKKTIMMVEKSWFPPDWSSSTATSWRARA